MPRRLPKWKRSWKPTEGRNINVTVNELVKFENNKFTTNFNKEHLDYLKDKLSEESLEKVVNLGSSNPENFVNFISFDLDWDGNIHKSNYCFGNNTDFQKNIEDSMENITTSSRKNEKVHIIYGDVFGNFSAREELIWKKKNTKRN